MLRGVTGLVNLLFRRLEEAGILPVSRFLAGLLVFLDVAIAVIMAHIRPVITWVGQVVEALAAGPIEHPAAVPQGPDWIFI